jgi:hypothetical protein
MFNNNFNLHYDLLELLDKVDYVLLITKGCDKEKK